MALIMKILERVTIHDVERAKLFASGLLDGRMVAHDGFMWRILTCEVIDNDEVVNYGGMWEGGPAPMVVHVPHPPTFLITMEREA
jgi:hypothetical protein